MFFRWNVYEMEMLMRWNVFRPSALISRNLPCLRPYYFWSIKSQINLCLCFWIGRFYNRIRWFRIYDKKVKKNFRKKSALAYFGVNTIYFYRVYSKVSQSWFFSKMKFFSLCFFQSPSQIKITKSGEKITKTATAKYSNLFCCNSLINKLFQHFSK